MADPDSPGNAPSSMTITYWGVRGSVPSPGSPTLRYGGNTSCVSVGVGGRLLVVDAGTGIRGLGTRLMAHPTEVVLLLTHLHADHLQGLPFFEPLYREGPPVLLLDHPFPDGGWTPLEMFDGVHFPLRPESLASSVRRVEADAEAVLERLGLELRSLELNHPGGSVGYRFSAGGRSFVHLTDNELGEPGSDFFDRCVEFAAHADVLSHDAQYRGPEMVRWGGRGHSSVEQVCSLARASRVGRVVLFHHDPDRGDGEIDEMEREANRELEGVGIACTAAYEGLEITL